MKSKSDDEKLEEILDTHFEEWSYAKDVEESYKAKLKAKAAIQELIREARLEELKELSLAYWQKPIPEMAVLERIKLLSSDGAGGE